MRMDYEEIPVDHKSSSRNSNQNDSSFSPFHINFAVVDEDDANFFNFESDGNVLPSGEESDGKSSEFATGFNFINSIVGAGIIGIPVAIKECGLFMGIVLLILVAYLVDQSVIMLIQCGVRAKKMNYEELCRHLLGATGYSVCVLSMLLFAYGAMVAYLVIIGDTVPVAFDYLFDEGYSPSRNLVITIFAICPVLFLSLMRSLSSLSYTSFLSISADVLLIIFILIRCKSAANEEGTSFRASEDVKLIEYQLFEGIGTMSFAFVCHHNTFIVYNSMSNASLTNWKKVSHSSIFFSFILCLIMGLGGFLSFGSYTEGDILNNFPENDRLILGGRLLLATTMVFTYPLECFVARHSLISLLKFHLPTFIMSSTLTSHDDDGKVGEHENLEDIVRGLEIEHNRSPLGDNNADGEQPLSLFQHIVVSFILWGSSLLFSLFVTDVRIVLALTGAIAASFLAYILPALLYMKTNEAHWTKAIAGFDSTSNHFQPKLISRIRKFRRFIFPIFLLLFGIMSLVVGVGTVLYDMIYD